MSEVATTSTLSVAANHVSAVTFYLLAAQTLPGVHYFICRLVEKIYTLGHHVLLLTENKSQATLLDQLLWTYQDTQFLPHIQVEGSPQLCAHTPILLTAGIQNFAKLLTTYSNSWVIINAGSNQEAQACFAQVQDQPISIERICEVIPNIEQIKAHSRQRYRLYQSHGIPIETQHLRE